MIAVGAMLVLLCGTCTVALDFNIITDAYGPGWTGLIMPSVGGGIPIAIGVWLILKGRSLYRGNSGSRGNRGAN